MTKPPPPARANVEEPDPGIEHLMECARINGALAGDEAALRHLFESAIEMGYWRGIEDK